MTKITPPPMAIDGGMHNYADIAHFASTRIGYYGCATIDRIVQVGEAEQRKQARKSAVVDCPCGNRHRVNISWRAPREDEEPKPEVVV